MDFEEAEHRLDGRGRAELWAWKKQGRGLYVPRLVITNLLVFQSLHRGHISDIYITIDNSSKITVRNRIEII